MSTRRTVISFLCAVLCTLGGTAARCQQAEPAAEMIVPYPAPTQPEVPGSSVEVIPYPPQPAVSIGGPFGIVIGRGYGVRIGGPSGVQVGGGRGVQIGPPANGVHRRHLGSLQAPVVLVDQITLQYPESAPNAMQFRINGSDVVIAPGETIRIDAPERVVVRVPKLKGGLGFPRSLSAGHYVFGETARGWRLFRQSPALMHASPAEPTLHPDSPPELNPPVIEFRTEPAPTIVAPPEAEPPAEEIPRPSAAVDLQPPVIVLP